MPKWAKEAKVGNEVIALPIAIAMGLVIFGLFEIIEGLKRLSPLRLAGGIIIILLPMIVLIVLLAKR